MSLLSVIRKVETRGPKIEAKVAVVLVIDIITPAKFGDKSKPLHACPRFMAAVTLIEIISKTMAAVEVTGAKARIINEALVPYKPILLQNGLKKLSGMLVFFLMSAEIRERIIELIQQNK